MTEKTFLINDVFHTFQGEGANAGRRSLFIRMPKCNLSCSWCDTEFNTYEKWPESKLISFIEKESCRFAVITGGEPLMNKQTPLIIELLKNYSFEIACETNGTFPHIEGVDFVTCSPKKDANYTIHPGLLDHVSEFKYVVDEGFDFETLDKHNYIEDGSRRPPRLSLSPEFNRMQDSLKDIERYITKYPWWKISLQTHKWIGVK